MIMFSKVCKVGELKIVIEALVLTKNEDKQMAG